VGGAVRVNGAQVKPHHPVQVGDEITARAPSGLRIVGVLALAERRLSAPRARELYDDRSPPPPPREEPVARRARGAGRPTKRERRELQRLRTGRSS
jgi:ribosome-associated heat shock protein Hsp15